MMNMHTGQSRTPMLDAALRKGREEGIEKGIEKGRLRAHCETAVCLGASQELIDQWVALGPAKGADAAMKWIRQTARNRD